MADDAAWLAMEVVAAAAAQVVAITILVLQDHDPLLILCSVGAFYDDDRLAMVSKGQGP